MKFTRGYWQKREGVRALHPVQLHSARSDGRTLTVYAATRPVTGRAETLDMPLVTITCSSPMADVIRIEVSHFRGGRPRRPEFPLATEPVAVEITTEPEVALTAGALSARFRTGAWGLAFEAGGRVLTESGRAGMGVIELAGEPGGTPSHHVHEQLGLGVGECVYGLGERFGPLVKNGQVVDIWNEDGGTCSELAYKNIPFYLTDRGYGVLVNHPGRVSFEVGSEHVSRVQFSVAGQALEYLVIYGPTPAEVLRKYTALTGRPALPPAWSFGLWPTTSFTTTYDEATVTHFLDGMAGRGLAFPDDPACSHLDRQYLLGGDLLVAPVFSAAGDVSYYVPAGAWTDLLRGTVVEGPRWVREHHGFDSVPLLARPGSVIALGARDDRPDYDHADGVTLRVHELCDGARLTASIPAPSGGDGVRFAIARAGREIRIERSGPPAPWRVLMVGRHTISASPGVVIPTPDGAVADLAMNVAFTAILLGNRQDEISSTKCPADR